MTEFINVQVAKTHLSRLLVRVERGEDIVIARDGVAIARLSRFAGPARRELGFVNAVIPDSFNDPLPQDELASWS